MGLLDSLEQVAAQTMANGQVTGAAAPTQQGAAAAIIRMVMAQPGGAAGLIQRFEQAGLGGLVQSWLAPGANQPLSPAQVQSAVGPGPIGQVAGELGISSPDAASHISQLLPEILDHLSPGGGLPAGGGLEELGGLLARFGGGRPAAG